MSEKAIRLSGELRQISDFSGQLSRLDQYPSASFDINSSPRACIVCYPESTIAVSKWKGPKRTRTYVFAGVYDTLSHRGENVRIVTVIPVVKYEKEGNKDRLTYATISLMSSIGIYVVLSWYKGGSLQEVKQNLEKIKGFRGSAVEWNKKHFNEDFVRIFREAIKELSDKNWRQSQEGFIDKLEECKRELIDCFAEKMNPASSKAARREAEAPQQKRENLPGNSQKGLISIMDLWQHNYKLTADRVIEENGIVIIEESKNSTKEKVLPSYNDIKDGLFKLLIYKNLENLRKEDEEGSALCCTVNHKTRLRITVKASGTKSLPLPKEQCEIEKLADEVQLNRKERLKLQWLNEELKALGIEGILEFS